MKYSLLVRLTRLCFSGFGIFIDSTDVACQLQFQCLYFICFSGRLRFCNFSTQENLPFRDLGSGLGIDLGDSLFLRLGELFCRRLFFESFHGQFVSGFHGKVAG